MEMDIDFSFLFSACNVLNHFLCAIAQTHSPAPTVRDLKVRAPRGGAALHIRSCRGSSQDEQMVQRRNPHPGQLFP